MLVFERYLSNQQDFKLAMPSPSLYRPLLQTLLAPAKHNLNQPYFSFLIPPFSDRKQFFVRKGK